MAELDDPLSHLASDSHPLGARHPPMQPELGIRSLRSDPEIVHRTVFGNSLGDIPIDQADAQSDGEVVVVDIGDTATTDDAQTTVLDDNGLLSNTESRLDNWCRALGIDDLTACGLEKYQHAVGALNASEESTLAAMRRQTVETIQEMLLEKGCALAAGEAASVGAALGFVAAAAACRTILANVVATWICTHAESMKRQSADTAFFVHDAVVHVAALTICAVAPKESPAWNAISKDDPGEDIMLVQAQAYCLLCAIVERNKGFAFSRIQCSECARLARTQLLPKVDPELGNYLAEQTKSVEVDGDDDRLAVAERLWLTSLWACEPNIEDAFTMWDSVLLESDDTNFESLCTAAVCASLVRRRDDILQTDTLQDFTFYSLRFRHETVDDDGVPTLSSEAICIRNPRARASSDVEVVSFGPGPLGILLTRKRRGLVVSNFSSEERRAIGSPQIADTLIAVNGRPLPRSATLNDAVALLGAVGRPVLVAFRRARPEDLAADAVDDAQAAARREQQRQARGPQQQSPHMSASTTGAHPRKSPVASFVTSLSQAIEPSPSSQLQSVQGLPYYRRAPSSPTLSQQRHLGSEPILQPLDAPPTAPDGYRIYFLAGEVAFAHVSCIAHDVALVDPHRCGSLASCSFSGELYCTSYRVIFHVVGSAGKPSWATAHSSDWHMPIRCLERCELSQSSATSRLLSLAAKDGQRRRFSIPMRLSEDAIKLTRAINSLAFSRAPDAFARAHRAALDLAAAETEPCDKTLDHEEATNDEKRVDNGVALSVQPWLSDATHSAEQPIPPTAAEDQSLSIQHWSEVSDECTQQLHPAMVTEEELQQQNQPGVKAVDALVTALEPAGVEDTYATENCGIVQRQRTRRAMLPLMAQYTLVNEYARNTLRSYIVADYPRRGLRLVRQHSNLALCETYPPDLVVPSAVSDLELRRVAVYRSKGRFPVVIWSSPDSSSGATISRSAQPKPGVQNKRSTDDERYLDELRQLCAAKQLVIIDARSKVATQGNRVMGMGTELTRYYDGVELQYGNIANIHAARDALNAVYSLCRASVSSLNPTSFSFDSAGSTNGIGQKIPFSYSNAATLAIGTSASTEGSTWLAKLDATTWLKQVHSILTAAVRTVELVHYKKTSVLVHCSDGWDRTPQITVLAIVMLDPHCRTIDGFLALCQKEWVDFGHKFDERCGHQDEGPADQRSPVFLLFIDCLANLVRQFPTSFEFNINLLLALMDQLFACRFGTFLENYQRQRAQKRLEETTAPFWWLVADDRDRFLNPAYSVKATPVIDELGSPPDPLLPSLSPKNIRFFEEYFLRFDPTIMPPRHIETFY